MRSRILVVLQFVLAGAIVLPVRVAGWHDAATLLVVGAVALGAWALSANRPGNFNVRPEPKSGGRLVTGGPYRYIRHPMYLALLFATAGFVVGYADCVAWHAADLARAAAWFGLATVLHVKSGIEERALNALHPGYAAYAQRTKRIIPFLL
jgi:protein-S-isoprenylcysteine O-methyltransferase Ste14